MSPMDGSLRRSAVRRWMRFERPVGLPTTALVDRRPGRCERWRSNDVDSARSGSLILQAAGIEAFISFEFLQGYLPRVAARVNELRNMGARSLRPVKFQGQADGVRYTLVEPAQMELVA